MFLVGPGVIDPDGARVTVANVRVSVLDDRGTVKVVWDPLSPDVTNGDLLGYKVSMLVEWKDLLSLSFGRLLIRVGRISRQQLLLIVNKIVSRCS